MVHGLVNSAYMRRILLSIIAVLLLSCPASTMMLEGIVGGGGSYGVFSQTLNIDNVGWIGYSVRTKIPSSALSASASKVSIRLEAASTEGMKIVQCYIGHAAASGNAWNFDGGQVKVTFGGADNGTITAGSTLESDTVSFNLDKTKDLIIAFDITNTDTANDSAKTAEGVSGHFKYSNLTSGTLQAQLTAPTGYATNIGDVYLVNRITAHR